MSWMKRRGQPSPNPTTPGITMYNPNQHSNPPQSYQQWQPNTQQQYPNNWYGQQEPAGKNSQASQPYGQQNYWQQPPYPQQNYQLNQPPYDRYQHSNYYENQGYGEAYQQNYNQQQNYYPEQRASNSQEKSENDTWNWGWEDTNSNQQSTQQNNQNVTESFANDESWNWSVDDTSTDNKNVQNEQLASKNIESVTNRQVENVTSRQVENEYETVTANPTLEQLPHASVSRLTKNENLTPQWSIESQVSQDSSDDIILTSESDNRSNILSRSSTVSHSPSRPASTHDNNTEPTHKNDNGQTIPEQPPNLEIYEDISKSIQNLSINPQFENKEIVSPENIPKEEIRHKPMIPPPTREEIKHPIKEPTPPPPRALNPLHPPSDPNKNPYKRTTGLSHSAANKITRPPKDLSDNIYNTQQVNLETLPDNSERPDQFPVDTIQKTIRKTSQVQQQWHTENLEIAPINDRNQYLETGQLSDADPIYNQNETDNNQGTSADNLDSLPPPGLRRVVPGQLEQSESNPNGADEPPPGLSRMVLGRTETEPTNANPIEFNNSNVEEPPVGLHRMVPGESSSPESSSYPRYQPETHFDEDNYASESELNQISGMTVQRSATIGADTPPATNQQANITGYSSSSSVEPTIPRVGAVGIDSERRETDLDGANTLDESLPSVSSLPPDNNRRDNIDGGPQEDIMIRNQTVGQNTSDQPPNVNQPDKGRKSNRNYTTDSDEQKERSHRSSSPNRYEKDRRLYDDRRDRLKDRESPDKYRKYDRRHRDKRYEEDTDYYSDKERNERRMRDDRDEYDRRMRDERDEYDRRYNSLRRNKERDQRKNYERDDRRNEYYYRYDDEYYGRDTNRSRPSSRSDSMHDSYRDRSHRERHDRDLDRSTRHWERDREKDHRRRDPYNQYYQGYNYDPYNPYYQQYQQYQYYENLRRTNPQAYAEWYRKYYQQQSAAAAAYNPDDRASVHSGRSSANGDMNKDRYTRQSYYSQQSYSNYYREIQNASTVYTVDDSRLMDNTDSSLILEDSNVQSQRLTPAKFSTAHVKASISSGYLLNVLPHYPLDGQSATIEIINVQCLLQNDEEMQELSEFPGPLIKGVTHKKTVIDYCENKIKKANNNIHDVESYILMWELLILLLRQNGMVVGTDIAELLMKDHNPSSGNVYADSEHDSNRASPAISHHKEEYITDKFREYLIYGSGKEALEWAMKHGLWGHALFLASKLDKRTYANVMMRFANGLTMNDPLQTLYQLLSGRQPAAVTCVADEKWGDWRPHLAMILSNTTQRPELDRKAITTLGDTLLARGSVYAAHFCYLMAQVEFGRYGTSNTKIVLLGSSHNKPFNQFVTNEAIFMTEIYEYACSLSDVSFMIPEFLPYKYMLATKLVDHGFLEKGLQYLERIADGITSNPNRVQLSLVAKVCQLSDRLKYFDPLQADDLDANRADATWLSNLKTILDDINNAVQQQTLLTTSQDVDYTKTANEQYNDQLWQQQQQQQQQTVDYYQQTEQQIVDYNQQTYQDLETIQPQQEPDSETVQDQQQTYWNQTQQWDDPATTQIIDNQQNYWNNQQIEESQPQITMPNQSRSYDDDADEPVQKTVSEPAVVKSKPSPPKPAASTGWFGGIWNKLSLRPKNQMKLPDDKNPTIVWDSEKKRWVNLEADQDDAANEIKPPPKMSEMYRKPPTPQNIEHYQTMNSSGSASLPPTLPSQIESNNENVENNDGPPKPSQPNMFKLQRRVRNIKNAYVDVFNPSGVKTTNENVPSAEEVFGAIPSVGTRVNYFVPAPVSDPNASADFLTPKQSDDNNLQAPSGGPMMYNPNDFNNPHGKNH